MLILLLAAACTAPVRPGISVLVSDSLHLIEGKLVGLLTNQTGIDHQGVPDPARLLEVDGVRLVALYSPEHGFRGQLDQAEVPDTMDPATGLPIYSLYGPGRTPTPAAFRQIEVLLIDLQDIGARTFTYAATMAMTLEAAKAAGVSVVVLDRPNPIGGVLVQGPVRDPSLEHFIAKLPVALRHGMTMGELALLANATVKANLHIVPVSAWRRTMWFDETGLPWVPPSPNMPHLESATHYPGIVIFEATNLSVGRGTREAFRQIGAPWLDPEAVLTVVDPMALHGVTIEPTTFAPVDPTDGKFADVQVRGVRLTVLDREQYNPVLTALGLLWAVNATHPDSFRILQLRGLDLRLGTTAVREGLTRGVSLQTIAGAWERNLAIFNELRGAFLLYR